MLNPIGISVEKHYPIVIGKKPSSMVYGLFLISAYICILLGVLSRYLPVPALLGLLSLAVAIPLGIGVYRNAEKTGKDDPPPGIKRYRQHHNPFADSTGTPFFMTTVLLCDPY